MSGCHSDHANYTVQSNSSANQENWKHLFINLLSIWWIQGPYF